VIRTLTVVAVLVLVPSLSYAPTWKPQRTVSSALVYAISRIENCAKWNNPGCLRFARQLGARRGPDGYAVFKTATLGLRALKLQISRNKGSNVVDFLKRYNPEHAWYPGKVLKLAGLKETDTI
jgi:hypothetical protein